MRRIAVLALSAILAVVVMVPTVFAQGESTTNKSTSSKSATNQSTSSSQAPGKAKQIGELSAVWWQQVLNESSPPTCGSLDRAKVSGNISYLANFTGEVDAN